MQHRSPPLGMVLNQFIPKLRAKKKKSGCERMMTQTIERDRSPYYFYGKLKKKCEQFIELNDFGSHRKISPEVF
jgi:hypothetical protein